MAGGRPSDWTDAEMLEALDLRDHDGATYAEIARRIGRSRSAVIGLLSRIDAASGPGPGDGTLPRGWWRAGIARRRAP